MKSKRKEFEFDTGDFKFGIEVNEEEGTFKYLSSSGKEIDDQHFEEKYQYRVREDGKMEARLLDDLTSDAFGRDIARMVSNGSVNVDEVCKIYSDKSIVSPNEKLKELNAQTVWHEEKNYIFILCLVHGNKQATTSIHREIQTLRNNLVQLSQKISNHLTSKLGAIIDTSQGWVQIDNRKKIGFDLDSYFEQDPKIFGLPDWDHFYRHPNKKIYYDKILGDSLKIVSSDVWTDEILKQEIEEGIGRTFHDRDVNHCRILLDGKYLKSSMEKWVESYSFVVQRKLDGGSL